MVYLEKAQNLMPDLRQSPQYANYLSQLGWVVEKVGENYVYLKKIPFLGYFAKIQRPTHPITLKNILTLKKNYRLFRLIVEPLSTSIIDTMTFSGHATVPVTKDNHDLLYTPKFRLCKSPYLPSKTLVINLTPSREEIIMGFKKDVRRALANDKKANAKKVNFYTEKEIVKFHTDWRKAVPWTRYVPSEKNLLALKKAFGENCCLYRCIDTSIQESVCGIVFLIADKTLYYYLAWSNKKYSHTADMYRLVWEGIKWGKRNGCTKFDFEGIYDTRFPNKSWLGFSHFKSRFGGKVIKYPGCYLITQ